MLDYVTNFTKKPAPGPYLGFGRAHFILTKGGSGLLGLPGYNMLYSVEVATTAATGKLVIYNGTDATGDVVATIDITTKGSNKYAGLYCPAGLYVEIDTGSSTCSVSIIYDAANPKVLTVSGNEITDAIRDSAPYWTTAQSGDMVDATTAPGGYGIRRAATNLFRRGQCSATTDYSQSGSGTTTVAIDATTAAPYSPQSIKVTTDGLSNDQGANMTSVGGQGAATGLVEVGSFYFKGTNGNQYRSRLRWSNSDASTTEGTDLLFTATGAWQLITPPSLAVAAGKTGDSSQMRVAVGATAGVSRAESFWIAHGMIETGQNIVAPYVATSGSIIAHSASQVSAPISALSVAQGWYAIRLRYGFSSSSTPGGGTAFDVAANFTDGTNFLRLMYREPTNDWRMRVQGASSFDASSSAGTFATGDLVTVVGSWVTSGGFIASSVSVNGGAFVAMAGGPSNLASFVPVALNLGSSGGALQINSDMLWFACGKGTLTDADAAAINGFGSTCPKFTSFPDAALATLIWPCVTTDYLTPF